MEWSTKGCCIPHLHSAPPTLLDLTDSHPLSHALSMIVPAPFNLKLSSCLESETSNGRTKDPIPRAHGTPSIPLTSQRKKYSDQAIWFLNGFWKEGAEQEAETVWNNTQKFIELDSKKKDGNELDEFWSAWDHYTHLC